MKYVWTTISTDDMETSILFYKNIVRLPIMRRFKTDDGEIAFLGKEGETLIELIQSSTPAPKIGQGISLGFAVESLEETLSMFKRMGVKIESGPFQPNENIRFFYVLDPNGVRVQFSHSS
ncbi:MAG: VOC family protein [Spirochaetales bacterium]|nr:VOC family protein [Spirochaetales bacterium]